MARLVPINDFLLSVLQFSHLYVRHNRQENKVDIISVDPVGVSRLCTLDVVLNQIDYDIFMDILKKSIIFPLQGQKTFAK